MKNKNISDTIKLILLILMVGTLAGQILYTAPNKIQLDDSLKGQGIQSLIPNSVSTQINNKTNNNDISPIELKTQKVMSPSTTNPNAFISRWDTSLGSITGSSNDTQIKLPLVSTGEYNFIINWGDSTVNETVTSFSQGILPHNYKSAGTYTLTITGVISGWAFNQNGDVQKIIQISQWGPLNLGNTGNYFYGAANLDITANDALNLTGTTNMYNAFASCTKLGSSGIGNLDGWNTSGITNMSSMFSSSSFNEPIGNWNVSSVTDMSYMFTKTAFNQSIGNWDVAKVADMRDMFYQDNSFNQPIGNWNVANVVDMAFMFTYSSFNQPIGNWNVGKVSTMDVTFAFTSFNQPIGNWNVSSVTSMSGMFSSDYNFDQPLGNWNVGKVSTMHAMFSSDYNFDQPLGNWNVSKVSHMGVMLDTTSLSVQNYNNLLLGWSKLQLQHGVTLDSNAKYSSLAINARQKIITTFGWTINDAGEYGVTSSSSSNSTGTSSPLTGLSSKSTGISGVPTIIAISLLAILMIERRKRL